MTDLSLLSFGLVNNNETETENEPEYKENHSEKVGHEGSKKQPDETEIVGGDDDDGDDDGGDYEDEDDDNEDEEDGEDEDEEEDEIIENADEIFAKNSERELKIVVIHDSDRKTDNRLHLSEMAQVLAVRAQHISKHGDCFIISKSSDPIQLAREELQQRKCPLKLRRKVGGNNTICYVEDWDVNKMALHESL